MQQSPEKFIERLRSLRLSGAEREALRAELIAKMLSDNPSRPILSPWSGLFATRRFQAAFLIALIIIGYGSSAALAAEGALPGDVLYPVKTRIVEPLARLVAAQTPEHEADFETALLDRRLREAEALDDRKTLDAPLRETVRENVRAQSARTEVAARRADEESRAFTPSNERSASSTIATSAPTRLGDDRRSERGSDKRDREEKRAERAARVLKEHARILERLELSDESDDDEEKGDYKERSEREEKDDD